jgi:hypothetical protein
VASLRGRPGSPITPEIDAAIREYRQKYGAS